jgi:hypothetical protein
MYTHTRLYASVRLLLLTTGIECSSGMWVLNYDAKTGRGCKADKDMRLSPTGGKADRPFHPGEVYGCCIVYQTLSLNLPTMPRGP